MSTSATAGWRPNNFSVSNNSSQQAVAQSQTVTRQPDYTKRGYEEYLKPPPSHPNFAANAAPLPMPSQRLQALYSTELLDSTKDSPVRDYLENERGLTVKTLRKYGVGQATYKFPNEDNNWVTSDCVTFPWIMSVAQVERQETLRGSHFKWTDGSPASDKKEGSKIQSTEEGKNESSTIPVKDSTFITRRIKVRSIDQKSWQRMEPSGGGWGLFGWHTIPHDAKELVITEGEYDAMAVYQATGRPAVSLPNGCRSLPVEVLPLLENIDKIYLWMDNDAAGQEGAEAFAKKLGLERTHIVRPNVMNTVRLDDGSSVESGPIKSPKDANEALLNGLDLERIIEDSKVVPHERIMTFQSLRNDVLHEILHPNKYVGAPIKSLPGLMGLVQGLRRGELTVLTGPTGSGKTTFLGQVSLDLAENGTNVLWGSFEIKNTRLIHKLLQQFAREPLPKGDLTMEDKISAIADRFEQLPLYFLTFHGGSDVDQVLEAMDYAGTCDFV
jgi:twinkle protein